MKKIKNIFLIFVIILLLSIFFNNFNEYFFNEGNNSIENIQKDNDDNESKKIEVEYYLNVDGDTAKFKLNNEIIKVRFLGIDAPETPQSPKGEGCLWEEASNFTKEKLENAEKIEIEYDEHALKNDKYDRILAWVWVDDNLLQEELIYNGLAKTYMLQDNYKYANILKQAENHAKNNNLGIWSINNVP